ncbi:nucleotide disphospho-sugar-binding domain-containing protein [Streptomyces iconiensis]|uniref:DUF1205 domain-containing protein n=1 Tax=Streptomyces iconiensis TaxID=1384038 RepID=A0ABT7A732_9ACTN|nr:nucleotide disphospho-sugar-binding domain-containing protein [Streptomyces iconiensis]MDJ1136887.1 DUF1205 domain-containing protein [Streptomyces iconiensis]
MRVLFITSGWPTHFYMMAPLAWAFRAAGHELLVGCTPSGVPAVCGAGLPAVALGPDIDYMEIRRRIQPHEDAGHAAPESAEQAAELMARQGAEDMIAAWQEVAFAGTEDIVGFARSWRPELIVTDPVPAGGLVAAHVLGVPAVRQLLSTDVLGSTESEVMLGALPGFAEHFARFGARFEGDPAHRTVDPMPPSMQLPPGPDRLQMRFVPYNGPGAAPGWLLDPPERPRVCVTWGSAGKDEFLAPQVADALKDLDVEVVAAVAPGQREAMRGVGPHVKVVESLPLDLLLPTCDLIVHQGGSSTILTAAWHGIPQMSVPTMAAEVDDARAHEATGAGRCIPQDEAAADAVRDGCAALLAQPRYREAAERLLREIQEQPTPAQVVRSLTGLAA